MNLSGSKWNLRKKRRRTSLWRVLLILVFIAAAVYFWQIYIPTIPPPFIPTQTPTRSPASFVLEAESLFDSGKLEQAEEAYLDAILADPRELAHYIELTRVRMFAGKYEEAEITARDALVLNPDSALAHAFLGWSLDFQAGNIEDQLTRNELMVEALLEAETAIDLNQNLPEVQAIYAEILVDINLENYETALEHARAAVAMDSTSLEAHRALAYVWEMTGNRELALESYEVARSLNSFLPRLHLDIGNMLRAMGDYDGARESYLNAVALSPTSTEPLTYLVQLYAGIGEYGVASQYARNAVEIDPANPRLRGNLGRMYYHNGVLDEAIVQFNLEIRGGQSDEGVWVEGLPLKKEDFRIVEFYYTYGLALAKRNSCEEAIQIFEAILQTVPEDEIAVFNAREGLILCGELERPPTPEAESTPAS
jgi:tetratricopeptide (TPR) repeat protein